MVMMAMTVGQLAPGPPGDPEAKSDQREAGRDIHDLAVVGGGGRPHNPDKDAEDQSGRHVTGARHRGGACRFKARPAALARQYGYGQPMVGNGRM